MKVNGNKIKKKDKARLFFTSVNSSKSKGKNSKKYSIRLTKTTLNIRIEKLVSLLKWPWRKFQTRKLDKSSKITLQITKANNYSHFNIWSTHLGK